MCEGIIYPCDAGTLLKGGHGIAWHVMRAYKCEAMAEKCLYEQTDMEVFIPKKYAVRVYHGVKSLRLVPVIQGLVFVRASRERIIQFKSRWNFLQFIMVQEDGMRRCMTVPDAQMRDFMTVATRYGEDLKYFRPEELDLRSGTRVKILGGVFDGVEGVYMRVEGTRKRRLVVVLDGILAVTVRVHPDLIEVL